MSKAPYGYISFGVPAADPSTLRGRLYNWLSRWAHGSSPKTEGRWREFYEETRPRPGSRVVVLDVGGNLPPGRVDEDSRVTCEVRPLR